MRRLLAVFLAAALAGSTLGAVGCQRKARVESGTRYVCSYGEKLGSDVKEIEVPASDAAKYSVTTKTITCSRHQQAENLYLKAQAAIKAGDLATAKKHLESALKLDSNFRKAAGQLAEIQKGKKPAPDLEPIRNDPGSNGSDSPTTAPAPGGSSPAMDAYRDIVPDTLEGFTAQEISAEELSLTRAYLPRDTRRYDQLVVMVQQYQSAGGAQRALDTVMKPSYPAAGVNVTASGLKGYFGINGQKFAIVSLVNGGVLVTLELHATGAKPESLKADLISLAEAVLD